MGGDKRKEQHREEQGRGGETGRGPGGSAPQTQPSPTSASSGHSCPIFIFHLQKKKFAFPLLVTARSGQCDRAECIPQAECCPCEAPWMGTTNISSPFVQTLPLASLPGGSHQSGSPWCCPGWPPWPPSAAPGRHPTAERVVSMRPSGTPKSQ